MENLKRYYPNNKVLLAFYGGSKVYGCSTDESDTDIVVVLDNFSGLGGFVEENLDYLVMGKNDFIKAHELSIDVNEQLVLFADSILSTKDKKNLIYLDEDFREVYETIMNKDWISWVPKVLMRILPLLNMYVNNGENNKKEYHVYRIRAMLDHLDQTGSFSLELAEPYKSKMIEYKNHYKVLPVKDEELQELLSYFINYAERKK